MNTCKVGMRVKVVTGDSADLLHRKQGADQIYRVTEVDESGNAHLGGVEYRAFMPYELELAESPIDAVDLMRRLDTIAEHLSTIAKALSEKKGEGQ